MIYKQLFVLISTLIFLRPHFDFAPPTLSVYLADLAIIGTFLFSLLILKFKIHAKDYKLLHISFLLAFLLMVPIAIHSFNPNSDFTVWLDYGKIVYLLMSFWFLYFLLIKVENPERLVSKIINYTFLIIFVVSIIQLLDFPIAAGIIRGVYGSDKLRTLWTGYPRVFGTFYNANWFGVYLVFYLAWLNSKFLYKEISLREYFVKGVLLTILFVISGSRTAMVGAMVAFFFQFLSLKQIKNIVALVFISTVIFLGVRHSANEIEFLEKTLSRFTSTVDTLSAGGISISEMNPGRWQSWMMTWEKIKDNPLFGSGNIDFIPHNSYLYFLNIFGVVGAIFTTTLVGVFIYFSSRSDFSTHCWKVNQKWKAGFIPAFLVMSLAAEFFFTTQVMLLVIFLYSTSMLPKTEFNTVIEGG